MRWVVREESERGVEIENKCRGVRGRRKCKIQFLSLIFPLAENILHLTNYFIVKQTSYIKTLVYSVIHFLFFLSWPYSQQLCVNVLTSSHKIRRRYLMMYMVICKEAVAVLALALCFI